MESIKQHDLAHFNVSKGQKDPVPVTTTRVAKMGADQEFSLYVQYIPDEICKNPPKDFH